LDEQTRETLLVNERLKKGGIDKMTAKRTKSLKTYDELWDVMVEISFKATQIDDKKLNLAAGKAMRLLKRLGEEIKKERGTITVFS
jgi:hypothetical protein